MRLLRTTASVTLLAVLASTWAVPAAAETAYVTDSWRFDFRAGPGSQWRILQLLDSGTEVELLGETEDGWVKAKVGAEEGWLRANYLRRSAPFSIRLREANAALTAAQSALEESRAAYTELEAKHEGLSAQYEALQQETETLALQLQEIRTLSANAIQTDAQNRQLLQQNQQMKDNLELAQAKVSQLEQKVASNEFYFGAGAILLGLVLGLILPYMRPRRKNTEWA
ncbi:MAG: TIGR04211 family SH3 domain-containing protein [Pseudomonadota bacterium]|nr:TIGR04211 family SH3 domain-containing protein [Pseudomonadota bacterium]